MPSIDLSSDLLNHLVDEGFKPGQRLPTISELQAADRLGVSASKVREQLEVARALGLVEVRSKTGMRLKDYDFAPAVRLSVFYALAINPDLFEMFSELRNHIERAFWHEACALLREEDKQTMWACVHAARAKLNSQWVRIPHEEHRRFHLTQFSRLQNPFVVGLLEVYWDAYDAIHLSSYNDYDYLQTVWDYHERIIEAISRDDYDSALTLFIEHTKLLQTRPHIHDGKGEEAVPK